MIALKEALVNKSNIKNVKRKEKLWILVPDGDNPLIDDAEYEDCANLTANSFYLYVLTTTQVKDVFERYPKWDHVTIYEYNGKLNQDELIDEISFQTFNVKDKSFLSSKIISKEKLLKTIK